MIEPEVEPENVYEPHEVTLKISHKSRKELRDTLIQEFLKENGGYVKAGKKYVQSYRYYVETLTNGKRVFLQRPAYLNKGMDFQVYLEGFAVYKNGKDKPPSHDSVISDLRIKKAENPNEFLKLLKMIDRVWNCEEPIDVLKSAEIKFKGGVSVEAILYVLKWLFIEQDMTYWSYDGRAMLKREIGKLNI